MYVGKGTSLAVKAGDYITPFFSSNIGLRQGDVLSPTLFNFFINDIIACFDKTCDPPQLGNQNIDCLLYADDLVLISKSENGLQKSISALEKYCSSWGLDININKTKVVVFNKSDQLIDTNIKYKGQKIVSVDSYKYLGIIFSKNGNLSTAKLDLQKRGQKAIFKLKSYFKHSSLSFNTNIHLFDRVIKPVMLYASDLWGCDKMVYCKSDFNYMINDIMEKSHLQHLRFSLGVNKKAPKLAVYGDTGRFPLIIQAITNSIKYYHRLANLSVPDNIILHNAFVESKTISARCGWFKNVKSIMTKCGISIDSVLYKDKQSIITQVKNYFQNVFIKQWKSELSNDSRNKDHGNKLRTYRSFKTTFAREHYLNACLNKAHCSSFAKLRLGAHNLQIERDRYSKIRIPPEQRLCKICNSGCCEDEFHFIMVCKRYDAQRSELFSKIKERYSLFSGLNFNTKFIWLFANADEAVIKIFAAFISDIFHLRYLHNLQDQTAGT